MHVFRRARVPQICLPPELGGFSATGIESEPWIEVDIRVDGDQVQSVKKSVYNSIETKDPTTDLGGVIVFPAFLDCHTHLDKCHTWERAPNPRGEFWDALSILHADAKNWTEGDVYQRASFALQRAWSHGTAALRTHLDVNPDAGDGPWDAIIALRDEWAGRIELQTVPLFPVSTTSTGDWQRIVEFSKRYQVSALGGFLQPNADLSRQLDSLLSAASELGLGIDLHVDESALADAECLRATAQAVLRNKFKMPVACGHCCSLALHTEERRKSTIDLVRAAGLQIITLPLCNQYLQGRQSSSAQPQTPRWRGLTAVHELLEAGVAVASASDNVRDAFYAWGDLDLAEVLTQTVRMAHLDTRMPVAPALVTSAPAKIMGLDGYGTVAPGSRADLIVFAENSLNRIFSTPATKRRFIRGETWQERPSPPYSELTG